MQIVTTTHASEKGTDLDWQSEKGCEEGKWKGFNYLFLKGLDYVDEGRKALQGKISQTKKLYYS